jgi:hypothetical protein
MRLALAVLLALAAFAGAAPAALAADPLEGRWEQSDSAGRPIAGTPVYDFVATGPTSFTSKVVRGGITVCSTIDDHLTLSRVGSQPTYRGTIVYYPATQPCRPIGQAAVELTIRPDGIASMTIDDAGRRSVVHFRAVAVRIDAVAPTFRERAEQAVAELKGQAHALGRRWDDVHRSIRANDERARAAADTSAERKQLAALQQELARVEKFLARVGDDRALREKWKGQAYALWGRIAKSELAIRRAQDEQRAAEAALQRDLAERSRLRRELVALGERLAGLDFDVREVTATADGKQVFRAQLNAETGRALRELDEKIAVAARAVAGLEEERRKSKAAFVEAQKRVLAAGDRIVDTLWANAAGDAAIEVGFLALDLGLATLRGGAVGLAAEASKKLVEAALFKLAYPASDAGGEVEAMLRREYGARLKNSFKDTALERVAYERALKETLLKKAVKDPLTKKIVGYLSSTGYQTAVDEARAALAREPSLARLKVLGDSVANLAKARRRIESYEVGKRTKRSFGRGLVEGIAKDAAKAAFKRKLEARELAAWIDYFEKDVYARGLWPHVQVASSLYWEAKDELDTLVALRDELQQRAPDLRIVVQERFQRGGKLRVELKGEGRPGPLAVVVGGVRATPLGGYVYELSPRGLQLDPRGLVLLEIR